MVNDPRDKTPNGTKSNLKCPDCGANLSYTNGETTRTKYAQGFLLTRSTYVCDGCHNLWRRTKKVKE